MKAWTLSCCTLGWRVTEKGFPYLKPLTKTFRKANLVHSNHSHLTHVRLEQDLKSLSLFWYTHTHPDTRVSRPDLTANQRFHLPHLQATAQYPHPRDTEGPITRATRTSSRLPRRPLTHVTRWLHSNTHSITHAGASESYARIVLLLPNDMLLRYRSVYLAQAGSSERYIAIDLLLPSNIKHLNYASRHQQR